MSILDRINRVLTSPQNEQAVHEASRIANDLSGAFGHPVRVKVRESGETFVFIPASDLKASGLTVVESAVASMDPVLSGSQQATENAERRIAKRVGDGYVAALRTFDPSTRLCSFEVMRATA